jgi:hypothetical protein
MVTDRRRVVLGTVPLALVLLLALILGQVRAQTVEPLAPGRQVTQMEMVGAKAYYYTCYLPLTWDSLSSTRWPLIIQMPPGGATKPNAFSQLTTCGIPQNLLNPSECTYVSDRFVVVSPWVEGSGYPAGFVPYDLWLKQIVAKLRIDPASVHFYGTCWGGNFAYSYGLMHPEMPASMTIFAVNDGWSWQGGGLDLTRACYVKDIPIRLYNASGDPYSPWRNCEAVATAINACDGGGKAEFTLIDHDRHEIYNFMDEWPEIYDWMLAQRAPTAAVSRPNGHTAGSVSAGIAPDDRVEIVGLNGQVLARCSGREYRSQSLGRGVHVVRVAHRGEVLPRAFVTK